jgi:hypothetical protein
LETRRGNVDVWVCGDLVTPTMTQSKQMSLSRLCTMPYNLTAYSPYQTLIDEMLVAAEAESAPHVLRLREPRNSSKLRSAHPLSSALHDETSTRFQLRYGS